MFQKGKGSKATLNLYSPFWSIDRTESAAFGHLLPLGLFPLRLRLINASLTKFARSLGESAPALGAFFGRRRGIANLFDCFGGELPSAQPPTGSSNGLFFRLDPKAELDQAPDRLGTSRVIVLLFGPGIDLCNELVG